MDQEPVTIGELSRTLAGLERRMEQRFEAINKRLDALQFVSKEAYELQTAQFVQRIEALEESRRWTVRTLVAAFIYPLALTITIALVLTR